MSLNSNLNGMAIFDESQDEALRPLKPSEKYAPTMYIDDLANLRNLLQIGSRPLTAEIVDQFLLAHGTLDTSSPTPLAMAARLGSMEDIQLLRSKGASPSHCDVSNESPLACAARYGRTAVITYFLDWDDDLMDRWVALNEAIDFEHTEAALLLSVDPRLQHFDNSFMHLPIHRAILTSNIPLIKHFLALGAPVVLPRPGWVSPLQLAVGENLSEAVLLLLAAGSVLDTWSSGATSPLALAVLYGYGRMVDLLLRKGANINYVLEDGYTALHFAARSRDARMLRQLAGLGDIDVQGFDGLTPINIASLAGLRENVECLEAQGADLELASQVGRRAIHSAAMVGCLEVVDLLLERGCEVDPCDDTGITPLHLAVYCGHLSVAQSLLGRGADINRLTYFDGGVQTPLDWARELGHQDVMIELLHQGALTAKEVDVSQSIDPVTNSSQDESQFTDNQGEILTTCASPKPDASCRSGFALLDTVDHVRSDGSRPIQDFLSQFLMILKSEHPIERQLQGPKDSTFVWTEDSNESGVLLTDYRANLLGNASHILHCIRDTCKSAWRLSRQLLLPDEQQDCPRAPWAWLGPQYHNDELSKLIERLQSITRGPDDNVSSTTRDLVALSQALLRRSMSAQNLSDLQRVIDLTNDLINRGVLLDITLSKDVMRLQSYAYYTLVPLLPDTARSQDLYDKACESLYNTALMFDVSDNYAECEGFCRMYIEMSNNCGIAGKQVKYFEKSMQLFCQIFVVGYTCTERQIHCVGLGIYWMRTNNIMDEDIHTIKLYASYIQTTVRHLESGRWSELINDVAATLADCRSAQSFATLLVFSRTFEDQDLTPACETLEQIRDRDVQYTLHHFCLAACAAHIYNDTKSLPHLMQSIHHYEKAMITAITPSFSGDQELSLAVTNSLRMQVNLLIESQQWFTSSKQDWIGWIKNSIPKRKVVIDGDSSTEQEDLSLWDYFSDSFHSWQREIDLRVASYYLIIANLSSSRRTVSYKKAMAMHTLHIADFTQSLELLDGSILHQKRWLAVLTARSPAFELLSSTYEKRFALTGHRRDIDRAIHFKRKGEHQMKGTEHGLSMAIDLAWLLWLRQYHFSRARDEKVYEALIADVRSKIPLSSQQEDLYWQLAAVYTQQYKESSGQIAAPDWFDVFLLAKRRSDVSPIGRAAIARDLASELLHQRRAKDALSCLEFAIRAIWAIVDFDFIPLIGADSRHIAELAAGLVDLTGAAYLELDRDPREVLMIQSTLQPHPARQGSSYALSEGDDSCTTTGAEKSPLSARFLDEDKVLDRSHMKIGPPDNARGASFMPGQLTSSIHQDLEEAKRILLGGPTGTDAVVTFATGPMRAYALLITRTGVRSLVLPHLNHRSVTNIVKDLYSASRLGRGGIETLGPRNEKWKQHATWIWREAVYHVLSTLTMISDSHKPVADLPRICWIRSGIMGNIPFHAVGDFASSAAQCTMDFVVSSYASSIAAFTLAASRHDQAKLTSGLSTQIFMTWGEGEHTGLPKVNDEVAAVKTCFPRAETNIHTTKEKVLNALSQCSEAHFACRGIADQDQPDESILLVSGLPMDAIRYRDLKELHNPKAFLAYVGACSSLTSLAEGQLVDNASHLGGGFQSMGFPHVIAMLWEIDNEVAILLANNFYRHLAEQATRVQHYDTIARALHCAIADIRDSNRFYKTNLLLFAPIVYLGS